MWEKWKLVFDIEKFNWTGICLRCDVQRDDKLRGSCSWMQSECETAWDAADLFNVPSEIDSLVCTQIKCATCQRCRYITNMSKRRKRSMAIFVFSAFVKRKLCSVESLREKQRTGPTSSICSFEFSAIRKGVENATTIFKVVKNSTYYISLKNTLIIYQCLRSVTFVVGRSCVTFTYACICSGVQSEAFCFGQ